MRGQIQRSLEDRPPTSSSRALTGSAGFENQDESLASASGLPTSTVRTLQINSANPSGHGGGTPHRSLHDDTLLHVIWHQRGLIFLCAIISIVAMSVYIRTATPIWSTEARIFVARNGPNLIGEGQSASIASENYLYTQCELIKSSPILALAITNSNAEQMEMFSGVRNRISLLKSALNVDVGKKDDIINVSLDSPYPDEAKQIVDEVVSAYQDFQSKQRLSTDGQMLTILDREKEKRDAELEAKTRELNNLRASQNSMSLGGDSTNITIQRLSTLSNALTAAQLETLAAKSAYEQAARGAGIDTTKPDWTNGISDQDAAVDSVNEDAIRAEMFRLRQQLESLSHQYMPGHPAIQSLRAHINELGKTIVVAARQRWQDAQGREHELQLSFDAQQKMALDQNSKSVEYTRIASDIKRLQDLSDSLDKRIKELSLTEQAGALNITLVEKATPSDGPTAPSKRKLLPLAAAGGILLGVLLGMVREATGLKFNMRPGSILGGSILGGAGGGKAMLGVPVFASVPRQAEISIKHVAWSTHLRPESTIAASFRQVRDALETAAASEEGLVQARTIAITSPVNGEGRSIAASNLAITLAKSGKRVCLVDADLRSPSLGKVYTLREDAGVSTVLTKQDPLAKAIQRTVIERLDLLPAGPTPEDPADLLNTPQFLEMLEDLTMKYDHVVVDTPAVLSAPDARIIAANCDATLLLISQEGATRRVAEQCREGLIGVGAQVIGVVINSAPRRATRTRPERNDRGGAGKLIRKTAEAERPDLPQLPNGAARPTAESTRA